MKLILEDIKKSFDKKEVLRGAAFTFETGNIYGLLGRNGAGKTTLFNCVKVVRKNLCKVRSLELAIRGRRSPFLQSKS